MADMPASVTVAGESLRHVASWANRCIKRDVAHADNRAALARVLTAALGGAEDVELDRPSAAALLAFDVRAHGYGTNRALIGTRDDCEPCRALGVALEELLPELAVQRRKRVAA